MGEENEGKVIGYEVQSQLNYKDAGKLVRKLEFHHATADYGEAEYDFESESGKHDGRTVLLFEVSVAKNAEGYNTKQYRLLKTNWERIIPQ